MTRNDNTGLCFDDIIFIIRYFIIMRFVGLRGGNDGIMRKKLVKKYALRRQYL